MFRGHHWYWRRFSIMLPVWTEFWILKFSFDLSSFNCFVSAIIWVPSLSSFCLSGKYFYWKFYSSSLRAMWDVALLNECLWIKYTAVCCVFQAHLASLYSVISLCLVLYWLIILIGVLLQAFHVLRTLGVTVQMISQGASKVSMMNFVLYQPDQLHIVLHFRCF